MEIMEESFWIFLITLISVLFLAFKFFSTNRRKKYNLPPSPGPALPVIGHLLFFKPPLYRTFRKLSEKTGPILSVRFGTRLFVVVSSPEAVEECFTKNDVVLANRPRFIKGKYVGYNYTTFTAAPYGDHWRNLRRLSSVEIFSTTRLNAFLSIRQDEVRIMLRKLYDGGESSSKVELKTSLSKLTFNIILRMIAGKRYFGEDVKENEEAIRFRSLIKEVVKYGGASNPGDFLPILGWFDYGGFKKNLMRIGKQMDGLLQGLIEEHRREKKKNTMVDHLLSLQESEPEYYTDEIIKGLMIVMVTAGTDTSSVTVEWAMSLLLNHPEILKKARAEIDKEVGESRLVDEPDLPKLAYLQNIILETLRMFPPAPLLIPHESSEDFKLGEYDVPKGTIVLINAWAIHRDPNVWDDPTSFNPDRFNDFNTSNTSTVGGAVMVANSKLLPFGMGRRQCPGSGLAQRMVGLALASMIQCFDWERVSNGLVDLAEGLGVTMPKSEPLEALCTPRVFTRNLLFEGR